MTVFEEILAVRAAEAEIPLTDAQIAQFAVYNEMLTDWNTRMNLTALTAPEDVAVKHIIDSLTAYDAALFDGAKTLIDVGTGAGLPGIPLAVYAPHIRVTLMDALQKRVRFLMEVTRAMGLTNTAAVHARAEEAARQAEHPVIKAYRYGDDFSVEEANAYPAEIILVDSYVRGTAGGTGTTFPWEEAAQEIARVGKPVLIAGGITAENAGEAMAMFRPFGLDVSGGIEENGAKSEAKIRAFMEAVRTLRD